VTTGNGAGQAARRPKNGRRVPERIPAFAHLSLPELRDYRSAVAEEEGRVSYWRRITQAKLDLLQTQPRRRGRNDLARALSSESVSRGRTALINIVPVDDVEPLPDLAALWKREVIGDGPARDELIADLTTAERQLSDYRAALHKRLDAATTELVARYRENPLLCGIALPTDPRRRRAATG
jgi:hypothetical protein